MKKKIFIAMHAMEIGGAERALLSLLSTFDYDQYDVDLFLMRHSGPLLKFIPDKVNLLREIPEYASLAIPFITVLKKKQFKIAFGRLLAKIKALIYRKRNNITSDNCIELEYSHKYTNKYMPNISDKHYDFAISYLTPHYFVAEKVQANKKLAWIHTDYSYVMTDVKSEEKMWSQFDYIASLSNDCTKGFLKKYPSLENKLVHIENLLAPNFIKEQAESKDFDLFNPSDEELNLLSVGRFCSAKNFDNIPSICKAILDKGVKIKWYIIGFGNDEQLINDKIQEFNVENNVIILGKKDNPYPYIKNCDIYIQPSRYEGKAITVQEAQCLGKPVIITDYPTAKSQLKDGYDGIIVPLDNQKCAEKIVEIINNPELIRKIAENAAKSDYSNKSEIDKLYNIIDN